MPEDIAQKLIEAVTSDFQTEYQNSAKIRVLLEKVQAGTATYAEAHEYAIEVSKLVGRAYQTHVTSAALPDGRMYYNIASRLLPATLDENYDMVSSYAARVQQKLNEQARLGIKAQVPPINQDKVDGLVTVASRAEQYDEVAGTIQTAMETFSQSVVDDTVKANAEFQYAAGLNPKIIRRASGGSCEWCARLAGVYDYTQVRRTGHDVWRRHQNCHCLIEYDPGTGQKSTVWNYRRDDNRVWTGDRNPAKIEVRKKVGLTPGEPSRAVVKRAISDGTVKDAVNRNLQERHCESSDSLADGRSYLYGTVEDAEALYNKLKTTGEPIMDKNGAWRNKERVVNDKPVGVHISASGEHIETRAAMIVYSKTGSHIYPRKEEPS